MLADIGKWGHVLASALDYWQMALHVRCWPNARSGHGLGKIQYRLPEQPKPRNRSGRQLGRLLDTDEFLRDHAFPLQVQVVE